MIRAIVGANWGDEGKGKITDMFAAKSDIVIRFQGGANAGHTIINEHGRFAFHLMPSGVCYDHTTCIIGNGVALDINKFITELEDVKAASSQIPVLRSANMSLGVNTVFKLAAAAAKILGEAGYDIEIVEKHHNKKMDAPSGTALAIADAINEAMDHRYTYKLDRSAERAKRETNEIGIQAVRGGTIVGEHEVFYCGQDEVIEIKHTAYSKAIFGKGAIQAARFLKDQKPGMYQMSDVIG